MSFAYANVATDYNWPGLDDDDIEEHDPWPVPTTSPVRVLGDGTGSTGAHPVYSSSGTAVDRPAYNLKYLAGDPYSAYLAQQPVPVSQTTWVPRRGLAIAVIALLLAALVAGALLLVSPALARVGSGAGRQALNLSGYGEVALATYPQQPVSTQDDVPVIDARPGAANPPPQVPTSAVPAGKYGLEGPPSISVQQIERVLAQYGSPAAGLGQAMLDLGVKYGIDPAFALAFFVHESGCGTKGVARSTKSLGNIRWTPGYDSFEGYRSYSTWESGMEDWYKLIKEQYIGDWNLRTVDQIIPVYAPWGDNNNPPTYISTIKSLVDSWRGK